MFRRNKNNNSIFQRIKKTISKGVEAIKQVLTPDDSTKNKAFTQRVRKAFGGKPKKTSIKKTNIKTPTLQKEWVKNKQGRSIEKYKADEIRKYVEDHNTEISAYREKIIERAYEEFDENIAANIQDDIKRAVDRDERSFSNSLFEDLRDLDYDEVLGRIGADTDIDEFIENLNDRMSIEQRAEMYKENYVKALYNEFGENDLTREVAAIIESLHKDIFMLSYFNLYSDTHLNDIYAADGQIEYVRKLKEFFTKLKKDEAHLLTV